MSNKINKPKMSSRQIIDMMRDEKGFTFKYISEDEAAEYLTDINNYMRTAAYRKNYTKIQGGKNDGYDVVNNFFKTNPNIINSLETKTTSPFTGNLIQKYFIVKNTKEPDTGKDRSKIVTYDDCPVWVLVELLSYGEFIRFYNFYYKKSAPVKSNLLQLVRSLRNATAHNNCMIANLNRNTSKPPVEIKMAVQKIGSITKSQRQKSLSARPMLEFVTMLYVYNKVVTEKVKYHHLNELKKLFYERMLEKRMFFKDNELIKNNYSFACIMIENLVK